MPLLMNSVNGFWKRVSPAYAEDLCIATINHARNPYFYEKWGIPDTLEGRFDCAVLHMCLLLRHLKGPLGQAVFDAFFSYTELTLREIGVSDLKVGRQVKSCAKFFYGALKAYEDGLEGCGNLREALVRNLYGNANAEGGHEIEAYIRKVDESLKEQNLNQKNLQSIEWPLPTG